MYFFGEKTEAQDKPREMEPEQMMAEMKAWALAAKDRLQRARDGA